MYAQSDVNLSFPTDLFSLALWISFTPQGLSYHSWPNVAKTGEILHGGLYYRANRSFSLAWKFYLIKIWIAPYRVDFLTSSVITPLTNCNEHGIFCCFIKFPRLLPSNPSLIKLMSGLHSPCKTECHTQREIVWLPGTMNIWRRSFHYLHTCWYYDY